MSRNGPFGLWMGMKADDVGFPLSEVLPFKFRIQDVPKPHSAFEAFILEIAPETGLAWIKAIGQPIECNPFGSQLIHVFDSMESKLASKYGPSDKADLVLPGTLWDEPADWMQGLVSQERILMTQWGPEYGSHMSDSLLSVALIASASSTSDGYIAVEYSFENLSAAEAEIAALEDDAL